MDKPEQQLVRDALIKTEIEELEQMLSTPKYRALIGYAKQILKSTHAYTLLYFSQGGLDDGEESRNFISRFGQEFAEDGEGYNRTGKFFDAHMESAADHIIYDKYATKDWVERVFFKEEGLEEISKLGPEALEELKTARETVYNSIGYHDRFIAEVAKVAEREGLEKALTKEERYKIKMGMAHTPEEYIGKELSNATPFDDCRRAYWNIKEKYGGKKEEGRSRIMLELFWEKTEELVTQAHADLVRKEAREIYTPAAVKA